MSPFALFSYFAKLRQNRAFYFLVLLFGVFLMLSIMAHTRSLLQLDERITRAFQRMRSDPLDRVVRFLTVFGDPLSLISLGALTTLAFWLSGRPWAGILSGLSILGLPLNFLIKQIIRRPRPDAAIVKVLIPVVGRSFPSGHAMTSIMFYGLLAFLVWVNVNHSGWRLFWCGTMIFLALAVGLSRVYLGVHWFSDVLGGWTAGLFFLLIMALIYRTVSPAGEMTNR